MSPGRAHRQTVNPVVPAPMLEIINKTEVTEPSALLLTVSARYQAIPVESRG